MDNLINNVSDNESWVQVSTPVVFKGEVEPTDDTIKSDKKSSRIIFSPVLTLQFVSCLVFIATLFICKAFFIDTFEIVNSAYDKAVNTSLFFDGDISSLDYSHIFASSHDEF